MRILVTGGRTFRDKTLLNAALSKAHKLKSITCLLEGGAQGADRLARMWAKTFNIPIITYPANWHKYGKGAGPVRNKQMLVEGKPDQVMAFPGGKGTANMIKQALAANVTVIEVSGIKSLKKLSPKPLTEQQKLSLIACVTDLESARNVGRILKKHDEHNEASFTVSEDIFEKIYVEATMRAPGSHFQICVDEDVRIFRP